MEALISNQNVEIIRNGNAAFRRGDWDTVAGNMHPHILIRTDARWPEQRIYGEEAALAWYRGLWESGGSDLRIEEMVDLGDRVLVRVSWHIRGLHSGIEGEQRSSVINTFRDGRVILEEFFREHEQALKAVGLAE
jgi:ketosteroid isomerase-like protein